MAFWLAVEDRDGRWHIARQLPCNQTHRNPVTGKWHERKLFYEHDRVKYFTPPQSIFIKGHKVVTASTEEEAWHSL